MLENLYARLGKAVVDYEIAQAELSQIKQLIVKEMNKKKEEPHAD